MTTDIPLAVNLILAGASLMDEDQRKSFTTAFETWSNANNIDQLIYTSAKEKDFNKIVDEAMTMTTAANASAPVVTTNVKAEVATQTTKPQEPKVSFADFF